MFFLQICHSGFLQSEGLPHYPLEVKTAFEQKNSKKIKPSTEKIRRGLN
nr:MAG TPA: envelope glycoprotein [Caudoviricetes sp.]